MRLQRALVHIASLAVAAPAAAQYIYRTVAETGQPAPGMPEGVTFHQFHPGSAIINRSGDIAFAAFVQGPEVTDANDEGVWVRRDGQIELIVAEGMDAPGTAGVFGGNQIDGFTFGDHVQFNDSGHTAFMASITGAESDIGIWRHDASAPSGAQTRLLMRLADLPPGAPAGLQFVNFGDGPHAVSESGRVAFRAQMETDDPLFPPTPIGLFIAEPGAAVMVAGDGLAPQTSGGALPGTFFSIGNSSVPRLPLADTSQAPEGISSSTVFVGGFDPDDQAADEFRAIWSGDENGVVTPLVQSGEPAPGSGGVFANAGSAFFMSTINAKGEFVFAGAIDTDGTPTSAELFGLYRANVFGSPPSPLFIEGPAPGVDGAVTLSPNGFSAVNDEGVTIFSGRLSGENVSSSTDRTLWTTATSPPTLLLREDDLLPGSFFSRVDVIPAAVPVNNAGLSAFMVRLTSSGFSAPDAILETDPSFGVRVVAREPSFDFDGDGQFIDVVALNMRSGGVGDADGMGSPLHDDGRVVFDASLRIEDAQHNTTSVWRVIEAAPDADGDGLWDIWETDGVDADGDGVVDLDLPAMGADPNRKDLFLEVDAMVGFAPDPSVGPSLVNAFANAPLSNPDGSTGVTLHFVTGAGSGMVDEASLPAVDFPNRWDDADDGTAGFDSYKAQFFGTTSERADPNWPAIREAKLLTMRYCIFGRTHSGGGSSGVAELPGNDFLVSLGGFPVVGGTPTQQASTFMHEFGHTLGLRHGGADNINYKTNYFSIMNYLWQFPPPPRISAWAMDYSRVELPTLNELSLEESAGVSAPAGSNLSGVMAMINTGAPGSRVIGLASMAPGASVDWDGDGVISGAVARDPNNLKFDAAPSQTLVGHNDWLNLRWQIGGSPNFQEGVHANDTADDEFDTEEHELINSLFISVGCGADLNEDGVVDGADLGMLLGQWGPGEAPADLNADGVVDGADLGALLGAWGPCE